MLNIEQLTQRINYCISLDSSLTSRLRVLSLTVQTNTVKQFLCAQVGLLWMWLLLLCRRLRLRNRGGDKWKCKIWSSQPPKPNTIQKYRTYHIHTWVLVFNKRPNLAILHVYLKSLQTGMVFKQITLHLSLSLNMILVFL